MGNVAHFDSCIETTPPSWMPWSESHLSLPLSLRRIILEKKKVFFSSSLFFFSKKILFPFVTKLALSILTLSSRKAGEEGKKPET